MSSCDAALGAMRLSNTRAGRQGAIRRHHVARIAAGFDHDVVRFHVAVDVTPRSWAGQGFDQGQGDERGNFRQETAVAFIVPAVWPRPRSCSPQQVTVPLVLNPRAV